MAKFIKDFSRVGMTNMFIMLLALLISMVIARTLGPEKNGIIATLRVYPDLFMSFGALGISQSSTYFLGRKIFQEKDLYKAIVQIWLLSSVISFVICYFLIYYTISAEVDHELILLAVLPIPFALFNTYISGIFLGKNQIGNFNKISWVPYLIVFISCFIFLVIFKFDLKAALLSMTLGQLFIFLYLTYKNNILFYVFKSFNWLIIRKMIGLGLVYALALLVINLNYKLDVIILDKLSTQYEVGIYTKGSAISQYLWQIPMIFHTIVFARSANSADPGAFSLKVIQLLRLSLLAVSIGAIALFLASDLIIFVLFGEAFADSAVVMRILLPGVIILTFYKVLDTDLWGRGKPWIAVQAMIPALIINVILNVILIPKYGAQGASFASTISYSVAGIVFIILYSNAVRVSIRQIFSFSKNDFNPIISILKSLKK